MSYDRPAAETPRPHRMHRSAPSRLLRRPRRVQVHIPSPLRSYTLGAPSVAVAGATLETVDDVLRVIDRRTPGFRFRIVDERGRLRPHVRIFHESRPIEGLDTRVEDGDELFIAAALSGG